MFFEIFEDLRFLKIFDPQVQILKNSHKVAEISAYLKNDKNGTIRHKRCFWDPGANFLTHIAFCMNLRLKFHHDFLVKKGLPKLKSGQFGGFLGVGEVGQLHFWKPLGWVFIHPKNRWPTPNSGKDIHSYKLVTQNCYAKHFRFPWRDQPLVVLKMTSQEADLNNFFSIGWIPILFMVDRST